MFDLSESTPLVYSNFKQWCNFNALQTFYAPAVQLGPHVDGFDFTKTSRSKDFTTITVQAS